MKRWKKFDNRDEEKGKALSLSTAGEGDTGEKKCSPSQVMCAPQWGGWVAGRPPQPGNPAGDQPGSGAENPSGGSSRQQGSHSGWGGIPSGGGMTSSGRVVTAPPSASQAGDSAASAGRESCPIMGSAAGGA